EARDAERHERKRDVERGSRSADRTRERARRLAGLRDREQLGPPPEEPDRTEHEQERREAGPHRRDGRAKPGTGGGSRRGVTRRSLTRGVRRVRGGGAAALQNARVQCARSSDERNRGLQATLERGADLATPQSGVFERSSVGRRSPGEVTPSTRPRHGLPPGLRFWTRGTLPPARAMRQEV